VRQLFGLFWEQVLQLELQGKQFPDERYRPLLQLIQLLGLDDEHSIHPGLHSATTDYPFIKRRTCPLVLTNFVQTVAEVHYKQKLWHAWHLPWFTKNPSIQTAQTEGLAA